MGDHPLLLGWYSWEDGYASTAYPGTIHHGKDSKLRKQGQIWTGQKSERPLSSVKVGPTKYLSKLLFQCLLRLARTNVACILVPNYLNHINVGKFSFRTNTWWTDTQKDTHVLVYIFLICQVKTGWVKTGQVSSCPGMPGGVIFWTY